MTPSQVLVLLAAAANTLILLGVVWRGGEIIGGFRQSLTMWTEEVKGLRESRDEHTQILARAVAQLDALEERVKRLECA